MGRFAAEGFKALVLAAAAFSRELGGQQQQQLSELQGEGAAQQLGLTSGEAIECQEQFLLQTAFPGIDPACAAHQRSNGATAQRTVEHGVGAVVPAHHNAFLARQQVDQRILQLGVHQRQHAGAASHHIPILLLQTPSVDLFHQGAHLDFGVVGAVKHRRTAQTSLQQLQHLSLFPQRGTAPQAFAQFHRRDVIQLLFLGCGEISKVGGLLQQVGEVGAGVVFRGHGRAVVRGGWQLDPLTLHRQVFEAGALNSDAINHPAAQLFRQGHHRFRGAGKDGFGDGNQQQGSAGTAPVPLQQVQFVEHRFHELAGVIRQIEGVVFQHRWREGQLQ